MLGERLRCEREEDCWRRELALEMDDDSVKEERRAD